MCVPRVAGLACNACISQMGGALSILFLDTVWGLCYEENERRTAGVVKCKSECKIPSPARRSPSPV